MIDHRFARTDYSGEQIQHAFFMQLLEQLIGRQDRFRMFDRGLLDSANQIVASIDRTKFPKINSYCHGTSRLSIIGSTVRSEQDSRYLACGSPYASTCAPP